ncbi:L,D-transpeptidase [Paenibacillus sp. NRS-1782]|uniref:L,D-transpeptidase n=1 Tax=unclassified Paenibacillus TaxID=185978 RepID=UPI003D2865B7
MPNYSIVVSLSDRRLYLKDGDWTVLSYPVGIGKIATQTPYGQFTIINKQPNPGGPFGAFWMGLSKPHYGIHGTNEPWSIGKLVSHGCIRMQNKDVLELQEKVSIGTPVTIQP